MAEAQAPQDAPFNSVVIEALVVMKIVKHGSSTFPTVATGATVGLDRNGVLEITNSFPFPTVDVSNSDSHQNNDASAQASAAPRQKSNIVYQSDMIKHLKEVNVDANNVGWYTSATMSNFVNLSFIENQYHYQKDNEKTVALVHDVSRSSQGSLSLRAFKLSASFMAAYKEGKFTTESLQKSKLSFKDILQEFPVTVHNTHLLTTFLHQIPQAPQADALEHPTSVGELRDDPSRQPLYPSVDNLDLSIDPFLEKTCDLLLESIDAHYNEVNNYHLQKSKLSFKDILQEFPVTVHNTHLLTTFLHQIPQAPQADALEHPTSVGELRDDPSRQPLYPSVDNLDLSIDPFLEKTCDLLLEGIDAHYNEVNNYQFYQRQLGREQAKISQWQAKRKAENAQRVVAKQAPLAEDEWQRLFKLPQEPSRLEGMLNAKQVEQYSKQVDGFTANITTKMFARLFKLPQEPSRLEGMLNAKQVEQYSKQVDGFTANITTKMFAVRENLIPKRA
ncbi:hypothetical protein BN1723_007859 [Verticillium longisporum]|uniref:Eukaryotic translation initiation factor 3 subunit H n=1 Tax=Verticillium longisporum TaxID=100787 RepID=A0A0G4NNR5_VERLO|nr:hypothetical protein BN1723_007859 [Verticillium longisporum]